jgi:hypothetical protein
MHGRSVEPMVCESRTGSDLPFARRRLPGRCPQKTRMATTGSNAVRSLADNEHYELHVDGLTPQIAR